MLIKNPFDNSLVAWIIAGLLAAIVIPNAPLWALATFLGGGIAIGIYRWMGTL